VRIGLKRVPVYAGHFIFAALVSAASFLVFSKGMRGWDFLLLFGVLFLVGIPIMNFIYLRSDKIRFPGKDTAVSPENIESLFQDISLDGILGITFERLRAMFGAQKGVIIIFNMQTRMFEQYEQSARGRKVLRDVKISSDNPLFKSLKENNQIIQRKKLDPLIGYDLRILDALDEFGAVVASPIAFNDRFVGAIMLGGRSESFMKSELEIIASFAVKIGVVYMNSYLWKEAIFRKDVEKEYELGRRTQSNFLPPESGIIGGFEYFISSPENTASERLYDDVFSEFGDLSVSVYRNSNMKPGAFVFLPSLIPLMQTYFRQGMNPSGIVQRVSGLAVSRGIVDGHLDIFTMQMSGENAEWSGHGFSTAIYNTADDLFSFGGSHEAGSYSVGKNICYLIMDAEVLSDAENRRIIHECFRLNRLKDVCTISRMIVSELEIRCGKRCFSILLRRVR
jgi:hypothetical protein